MVKDMTSDREYLLEQQDTASHIHQDCQQIDTQLREVYETLLRNYQTDIGSGLEPHQ